MTCLMLGYKNQVIGNYGVMVHVYFHELWFIVSGISYVAYFYQAFSSKSKSNGNIFCSSSGFRDKTLYIKG